MMASTKKPSAASLKDSKLLKAFTDSELSQIISMGVTTEYEAHANIVIEGELSWGLYIILKGTVGIFKTNKLTGANHDIGELKAGNFFGELSLIDENPRSATVRAMNEVHVFYLSKDAFMAFLDRSSQVKLKFYDSCIKTLVSRLRELDDNYVVCQYQLWETALKREAEKQ